MPLMATDYAPIPLDSYANRMPSSNELVAGPRQGSQFDEMDGVEIRLPDISHSRTELAVGLMGKQPTAVRGIQVGYSSIKRLHFFHSVLRGKLRTGAFAAKYVVHYEGGRVLEIPLIMGRNIGSSQIAHGVPGAKAIQAVVDGDPRSSFVYHMVWKNPFPQKRIISIDFIAVSPNTLVSLSVLTAELGPVIGMSSRYARDFNVTGRLHHEFRTLAQSATIYLQGGGYSASATKSLRQVISDADAAAAEATSLRKTIRQSAEGHHAVPSNVHNRLVALSNRHNSLQVILTRVMRSQ